MNFLLTPLTRERNYRTHGTFHAAALVALTSVLAGCSGAYSQTEVPIAAPDVFNLTVVSFSYGLQNTGTQDQGAVSSPLPASPGLYEFDSVYSYCAADGPSINQGIFSVVSGPDKGLVFVLAPGPVKFWLRPLDQVQFATGGDSCTMSFFGRVVYSNLETLK